MNRKPGLKSKAAFTGRFNNHRFLTIGAVLVSGVFLSGCNLIKQVTGGGGSQSAQPAQPGQTRPAFPTPGGPGQGGGSKTQPGAGQKSSGGGSDSKYQGRLGGYWKLAYKLNSKDETFSSSVKLSQNGQQFNGQGTDDHNNKPFSIEQGAVQNGKVIFYKRYDNPSNANQTPVEYEGTVDLSGNPYMSGEFIVALNGQELKGVWEAEKDSGDAGGGGQQAAPPPEQAQKPQQQPTAYMPPPDHAPDLSGKWKVGFEYRFKEVQSTMWLEQDRDKLRGHGVDHNTKEKFQIEKGWYAYPKVTIIRKYPAHKSGKIAIPEHKMTFKAQVEWVSDKDYVGPYMRGKTDGGGNWEAQLVR